mmetsp:Transcript_119966/g.311371  ORF Transcript_119966/g.311371 Transcript_119966/m.311371 type:complete len:531 (+) Transcript_119966:94-1686(+)
MLDLGLVMYGGLLVLALWRVICFYRCCGLWLSFLNYTSLLYLILAASLIYSIEEFYKHYSEPLAIQDSPDADLWTIGWLRPFVLGAPGAVVLSLILCWFQTESHVFEIHKDIGTLKHDRAVQIIALPSVFAVMAMASMVPIYELVTGNITTEMLDIPFGIDILQRLGLTESTTAAPTSLLQQHHQHLWPQPGEAALNATTLARLGGAYAAGLAGGAGAWGAVNATATGDGDSEVVGNQTAWQESLSYAMWRYETCFYVGDLFEAWALYQFGLLALELIRESFENQLESENEGRRYAAQEMLASLNAVSSLAWLGTMSFVVVCVGQTATSLLPYLGQNKESDTQGIMLTGFQVAGFISSGVALYNVFVVERAFHSHLERSSPLLKFMSVKILVSLSFFQRGVLVALQQGNKILPDVVQKIVAWIPLFGDILNMTEVQLHLFYPALILYECLLTSFMHFWAWSAGEDWYLHGSDFEDDERRPLLDKRAALAALSALEAQQAQRSPSRTPPSSAPRSEDPEQERPALAAVDGP